MTYDVIHKNYSDLLRVHPSNPSRHKYISSLTTLPLPLPPHIIFTVLLRSWVTINILYYYINHYSFLNSKAKHIGFAAWAVCFYIKKYCLTKNMGLTNHTTHNRFLNCSPLYSSIVKECWYYIKAPTIYIASV